MGLNFCARRGWLLIALIAAAVALLAGCSSAGGSGGSTGEPAEAAGRPGGGERAIETSARRYLGQVADSRRRSPLDVEKAAAPNSPAAIFLEHLHHLDQVLQPGHASLAVTSMRRLSGDWELCFRAPSQCLLFGSFALDEKQRVASFSINGQPIEQLVVRGTGLTVQERNVGGFEFRTAYRSPLSNAFSVVLEVQVGSRPVDLDVYAAQYRGPDESLSTASDAKGPTSIEAYGAGYVYLAFRQGDPGGVVFLDGCAADCTQNFEVQVPVREGGSPPL